MKRDWEFTNTESEDEEKNRVAYMMFFFGVVILIGLFIFGNISDDVDLQTILAIASILFITISILWSIRRKLQTYFLSFLGLISIYFGLGWLLEVTGVISNGFSYGAVTFVIIFAFMFWIGTDGKLTWDDFGKGLLFMIVCGVVNETGWLGNMNELVNGLLAGNIPFLGA